MGVSTEGYGLLARAVRDVAADADAALAFVLEGGYGLDTLSQSIRTVHEVFDGYEPAPADGDTEDRAHEIIEEVRETFFDG
jgi:acetoin utilization deacetylase AcuC-like enzyme